MTAYLFQDAPAHPHQVHRQGSTLQVDGHAQQARVLGEHRYAVAAVDGAGSAARFQRVHAVAHGDTIHLQMGGRSVRIDRVDATRQRSGGGAEVGGAARSPMPGVVVSWVAQPGATVRAGEALLVIESMKLQMTIEAPHDGILAALPFAPGQTFERNAVLAQVHMAGDPA